jgi:transposase InsO family protein
VVRENAHKYSISAMCRVLQISRSTYYYESKAERDESELTTEIKKIFHQNRRVFGTRKIKQELGRMNICASRRRIGRIMRQAGLVSKYTVSQYRVHKDRCNESEVGNVVDRQFGGQPCRKVVVSDLTYVRVGGRWNYVCVLVDLFNREIIGHGVGANKSSELVRRAFQSVCGSLSAIRIFHTDRGSEFKNQVIDEMLEAFGIKRSLSRKGCPYDNAVAEAAYKVIKTEFINHESFADLDELQIELDDYVNWYNNHRIHSSLGYLTPVEYRQQNSAI